jgi:hypothetical protein
MWYQHPWFGRLTTPTSNITTLQRPNLGLRKPGNDPLAELGKLKNCRKPVSIRVKVRVTLAV